MGGCVGAKVKCESEGWSWEHAGLGLFMGVWYCGSGCVGVTLL